MLDERAIDRRAGSRGTSAARERVHPNRLGWIAEISERRGWSYLLLLPSLVLVAAVVIYPVGSGFLLSFKRMLVNRPRLGAPWVGLDNYRALLEDEVFRIAAQNT